MDILQLIDRLEELFNESKSIPLTRNVMVDEDRMLDIIDQMRIAIPEEVKKAQQLLGQRDRVLAQAQEEANRTLEALIRDRCILRSSPSGERIDHRIGHPELLVCWLHSMQCTAHLLWSRGQPQVPRDPAIRDHSPKP